MAYRVILKKNEEKRVLAGHSWVYANEVARIEGKDKNGSLAEVVAHDGRYIGKGYINHLSKILVRIFIRGQEEDGEELYRERIAAAQALREKLFDSAQNNCYRLVFAEADDLPALIIDCYAGYFVLECLSLGVDMRKKMIADALVSLYSPKGIYMRGDVAVRKKEGLPLENELLYGEIPDKILIKENGLLMSVDVKNGQKTGYFLDQKENRFAVRRYCRGASVLDCFCNSGGFSLNAATVAREVTALDISPFALENVEENARLNGFTNIKTECADVFDALTSNRPYRRPWSVAETEEYMLGGCGVHFDFDVTAAFLRSFNPYPVGTMVSLSDGRHGVVVKNNTNVLRPVVRIYGEGAGEEIDLGNDFRFLSLMITGIYSGNYNI